MARLVRFRGRAHHLPNDSMRADPVSGVWYVGEKPTHLPESTPTFTELVFDRALAEHCGRSCGPECTGDCFAEWYAGIGPAINDTQLGRRWKNERLFDCLPWPEETEETIAPASTSIPAPEKPPRRAARAAKE